MWALHICSIQRSGVKTLLYRGLCLDSNQNFTTGYWWIAVM